MKSERIYSDYLQDMLDGLNNSAKLSKPNN